jgi:hypothetical protein
LKYSLVEEVLEYKNESMTEALPTTNGFSEGLTKSVLESGGQVVVQDFTGRRIDDVFKQIYREVLGQGSCSSAKSSLILHMGTPLV